MAAGEAWVLVADDDGDLLRAYQEALDDAGYKVLLARSGQEALELVRTRQPDVLVSDIVMPSMDGFELIQRLREELGDSAPPAIVCSGFEITEHEALRRGARLFLSKPVDMPGLLQAVAAVRRGSRPADGSLARGRQQASDQRRRSRLEAAARLGPADFDRDEARRLAADWMGWLRGYLDCAGAGVFLLGAEGLETLVTSGDLLLVGPGVDVLRANLAEVVETRTSLLVGNVQGHPAFAPGIRAPDGPDASFPLAFLAGVPLLTPEQVPVGALCVADPAPRAFEAESLMLLEFIGRRGTARLFGEVPPAGQDPAVGHAPLLPQGSLEALLAIELALGERLHETVELAVAELTPHTSAGVAARALWESMGGPRMAIGALGSGCLALFKRGRSSLISRQVTQCLQAGRQRGQLAAVGAVSVGRAGGLGQVALLRMAETALADARRGASGQIRRIVVRPEERLQ